MKGQLFPGHSETANSFLRPENPVFIASSAWPITLCQTKKIFLSLLENVHWEDIRPPGSLMGGAK